VAQHFTDRPCLMSNEDWAPASAEVVEQLIQDALRAVDEQILACPDDELRAKLAFHRPKIHARVRAVAEARAAELLARVHREAGTLQ
jgi:hypothetical protein